MARHHGVLTVRVDGDANGSKPQVISSCGSRFHVEPPQVAHSADDGQCRPESAADTPTTSFGARAARSDCFKVEQIKVAGVVPGVNPLPLAHQPQPLSCPLANQLHPAEACRPGV